MPVRWDASRDHQHMSEKNARAPGTLVLDNQKSTQKYHFYSTSNEILTFLREQPFSTPPLETPPRGPPPRGARKWSFFGKDSVRKSFNFGPGFFSWNRGRSRIRVFGFLLMGFRGASIQNQVHRHPGAFFWFL